MCEDCEKTFKVEQDKLSIFLSYGHDSNQCIVDKIRECLESRGHNVWIDKSKIKAGEDWRRSITNGLLESNAVVSCLSKHSTRVPGVCIDELRIAVGVCSGHIKTVLLESEDQVSPPSTVSEIQWLDMHQWREILEEKPDQFDAWFEDKMKDLIASIESEESLVLSGEITNIRSRLGVSDYSEKLQRLLKEDYLVEDWLMDRVLDWVRKPEKRGLIIYGSPGSGKSMFAAQLISMNPEVVGYAFFEKSDGGYVQQRLVRSLALQMASKLPDYRKLLLSINSREIDLCPDVKGLMDLLITRPLNLLIDGHRTPRIIVLDGLDELDDVHVIESISSMIATIPEWIRVIMTSRPESKIEVPFENAESFMLDGEEHRRCMRNYCSDRIEQSNSGLVDEIMDMGGDSFLYVNHVVKDDRAGLLDRTKSLPSGMSDIYRNYMARISVDYDDVRKIMELIVSGAQIEKEYLAKITGLDTYKVLDVLRQMGSLLQPVKLYSIINEDGDSVPKYSLKIFHRSFLDWMTNESQSLDYYVDPEAGLERLIDYLNASGKVSLFAGLDKSVYGQRFRKDNIPAYLCSMKRWDEAVVFLLRGRSVPSSDKPIVPLNPYYCCVTDFPEDYDLRLITEAIDGEMAKTVQIATSGYPQQAMESLKDLYLFWGHSTGNRQIARQFVMHILTWPKFLTIMQSGFSDAYHYDGLEGFFNRDKLTIALMASTALEKVLSYYTGIDKTVIDTINRAKLHSLYVNGKFDWYDDHDFFVDNVQLHMFFKRQICELDTENETEFRQKSVYNSICYDIEMLSTKPDTDYLEKLINNGAVPKNQST